MDNIKTAALYVRYSSTNQTEQSQEKKKSAKQVEIEPEIEETKKDVVLSFFLTA